MCPGPPLRLVRCTALVLALLVLSVAHLALRQARINAAHEVGRLRLRIDEDADLLLAIRSAVLLESNPEPVVGRLAAVAPDVAEGMRPVRRFELATPAPIPPDPEVSP